MLYFFFAALLRLASFSDASTNQSIGSSGWDNDVVGRSKTQTQSTQSIGSSGWDNDVVARPASIGSSGWDNDVVARPVAH